MKLTTEQLKQMIKEELNEVMITPFNVIDRALQDPQVDDQIKNLLQHEEEAFREQGVELLGQLYPDDYPFEEIESYQASDEYQIDFGRKMHHYRNVARLRELKEFIKSLPGNIDWFQTGGVGSAYIKANSEKDLENAIKLLMEKYRLRFEPNHWKHEFSKDPKDFIQPHYKRLRGRKTARKVPGFYEAVFKIGDKFGSTRGARNILSKMEKEDK